jgi:hypothetical protein
VEYVITSIVDRVRVSPFMTPVAFCGLVAAFIAPVLTAGPVENAIVAAMRLSERANYSWVSTVDDDARTYDISGKTSTAGYSQVRMPVINSVRRRMGRGTTDNQIDLIFRGNVNCVLLTDDGWKTVDELPVAADTDSVPAANSSANRGSILGGAGAITGIAKVMGSGPKVDVEREERGYSNLQLGISLPHEELGVIVTSGTDLRVEGDTLTGTLTELGAQLLLVRDGQSSITPLRGSGSFTLWLRGGIVSRYQVKLEGVLAIKTAAGVKQVEVRQSASTILKNVGTTILDVPVEAKQKLGG